MQPPVIWVGTSVKLFAIVFSIHSIFVRGETIVRHSGVTSSKLVVWEKSREVEKTSDSVISQAHADLPGAPIDSGLKLNASSYKHQRDFNEGRRRALSTMGLS